MQCHRCGCCSDTPERCVNFSLEISENPDRIENLLANHLGEQPLKEGDDPYKCPKMPSCGPGLFVTRDLSIQEWPTVLVLSLKRWATFTEDNAFFMRKIGTFIDFQPVLLVPGASTPYHLRGVIEHHGEAAVGHYTSYVRACNNLWYHCDDELSPQQVPVATVLGAQAYVLVYES